MESSEPSKLKPEPSSKPGGAPLATRSHSWRSLWSPAMVAWCWTPIVLTGVFHYLTSSEHTAAHDILRRLYYLPIIFAAVRGGLRAGLAASLVVSVTYLPHAFMVVDPTHLHMDPGGSWEKALEIVLFNTVGLVAGGLASLERRRADELQVSLDIQHELRDQLVKTGRLSSLGELIAGVTHEVKTALHALRGTAEIVDPLIAKDRPERRMWDLHRAEIERLSEIAERFQAFAKPQPGKLIRLDLNEVIVRLGRLVESATRRQDISVDVQLSSDSTFINGDQDQLAQVGLNIAMNAIHALGDRGGHIRLRLKPSVRSAPRMHALIIENDGPPIPEAQFEQMFDPFVSGTPGNSGLGLAIASRIASLCGGFIEAANEGLGVTFTVYLPAFDSDNRSVDHH